MSTSLETPSKEEGSSVLLAGIGLGSSVVKVVPDIGEHAYLDNHMLDDDFDIHYKHLEDSLCDHDEQFRELLGKARELSNDYDPELQSLGEV
jgi:hypothetical protein